MARNRWDDEYDSHQEDQNPTLTVDTLNDNLWYQDSRFDA